MKAILPRLISDSEAAIIRCALQQASLQPADAFLGSVNKLTVMAICECGCGSVSFRPPSQNEQRLADGVAYLPSGERVDVLVWVEGTAISQLELVDYGQAKGVLPIPESVTSWERTGMVQQGIQPDSTWLRQKRGWA